MEWHQGNDFACDANSQSQSEDEPSNKRPKNSFAGDLAGCDPARAIGKMFFRTKLCPRFPAGTCRYATNCNFAHGMQELRHPPSNWKEIVATNKGEPTSDIIQIPIVVSDGTTQGYSNRQYCENSYREESCLSGDSTFLHHERNEHQTDAICLVNGSGYGIKSNPIAPNWKTKMCNKWEQTGYCTYGNNCVFAHGTAELHCHGGGLVKPEVNGSSTHNTNHGSELAKASASTVPHSYRIGAPSRKLPNTGEIPIRKWKGPDKISKIYGDWIDDLE